MLGQRYLILFWLRISFPHLIHPSLGKSIESFQDCRLLSDLLESMTYNIVAKGLCPMLKVFQKKS